MTPSDAANNCHDVYTDREKNIKELQEKMYDPIDAQIRICRNTTTVTRYVEEWAKEIKLKDKDREQSIKALRKYMKEIFPFMTYMAVAYPPYWGAHDHWGNTDIKMFR